MINIKMVRSIALGAVISAGLLSSAVMASSTQKGYLQVTSKVQKMVYVNHNGKRVATYVPAKKVIPGEIVQYNTFFQNISNQPADNINIVNPIPKHTVYLPNSAQGQNTQVVFSVDGGRHYAPAAALKVRGKDGRLHPAKPSDYTHIRWQYRGSLPPKQRKAVGFRVRLL
jgi:uncharacterized repeat protein (TIGR01451 family)